MARSRKIPLSLQFEGLKVVDGSVRIFVTMDAGLTKRFTSLDVPMSVMATPEVQTLLWEECRRQGQPAWVDVPLDNTW